MSKAPSERELSAKLTEGECEIIKFAQVLTLRRLLPSHRQRKNEVVYWYSGVPPSSRRKAFIPPVYGELITIAWLAGQ